MIQSLILLFKIIWELLKVREESSLAPMFDVKEMGDTRLMFVYKKNLHCNFSGIPTIVQILWRIRHILIESKELFWICRSGKVVWSFFGESTNVKCLYYSH